MKKIIKVKRESKFIKILGGVFSICFFLLLLTMAVDPPFTYGDFFIGTTISAYQPQSKYGSQTRLIVRLDNGQNVEVKLTVDSGPFVKGKRLIVQERSTMIFKRKTFRFIQNIDKQSSLSEEQQLKQVENRKGV